MKQAEVVGIYSNWESRELEKTGMDLECCRAMGKVLRIS